MPKTLEAGARVLVLGKHRGTIRFVGQTQFKTGLWIGVELDKPVGRNDGSVQGNRYFNCSNDCGLFVRPTSVEGFSEEVHAANKISSISRRLAAKKKTKHKVNQETWNALENHQEQLNLRIGATLKDVQGQLKRNAPPVKQDNVMDVDAMDVVESSYKGAHLTWPLTQQQVLNMLEHFKYGRSLHYKYCSEVLARAKKVMGQCSSLEEVALPPDDSVKLTVVGDLHGQLQDLYSIFAINELPSETNWYLFNGDFVDRGECGVEIVMAIMCFKLLYPQSLHFNRGNHESRNQNSWMGFEEEVQRKYGSQDFPGRGAKVYEMFQDLFDCLPLCHLIEKKIFVVHGGLSARYGITLAHLKSVKRKREPPLHGTSFEDRLIEDMLWSDPRNIMGTQPSERGAGVEFGQEVTNNFCAVNSVALIIRSHECVMEGFEVLHGGRLITLFSASRYCGTQTNKGAFLTLGRDLQPAIQQFYAHSIHQADFGVTAQTDEKASPAQMEQALEENVYTMLIERICDHKPSLYWYFTQHDDKRTGCVSRLEWANALRNVLGLANIPFIAYQPRLAELEEDGTINYTKFLERYEIKMAEENSGWQDAVLQKVCSRIYQAMGCGDIQEAFSAFDVDGDNYIEYEEFMATLKKLDVGLSDMQIYELMRSVDVDCDSKIDFKEFAGRFEVVFTRVASEANGTSDMDTSSSRNLDDWTLRSFSRIGQALLKKGGDLASAFKAFDTDGDKNVNFEEFVAGVDKLKLSPPFKKTELKKLLSAVDIDSSGQIDYEEFVAAFKIKDNASSTGQTGDEGDSWQNSVLQQVANVLYQHRIHIRSAFRMFDIDNSGTITAEEFHRSLATINQLLDEPLTTHQISELLIALDTDGDGQLSYKEFFEGFTVVDKRLEE